MLASNPVVQQKAATFASYAVSSGLFVGDTMNYLTQHAAGFGVVIAIATFLLNWRFQHKNFKKNQIKEESK
jgi:uncharacterized iron-regulated membrane protein